MAASQLPTARQSPEPHPDRTAPTRAVLTRSTAAAPEPTESLVLTRYRLHRRLGSGAFGTVWLAHDERLDRPVAVKAVPRERVSAARLAREARAAARLSHPAIVTLYETAVDDECAYLVSELVRGETLHTLLEDGCLSDRDVVEIAIGLCEALEHAHERGVIHRDVKPSNILVPEAPSSRAHPVKLTDFGVARVIGGDSLTKVGDVVGTAAYMAPEQAEGLEAGPAADLYALALVVYEALTGDNPVRAGGPNRARRLGTYLPPLRRRRRDLPRELGRAIDLALRPRPRERGTVGELRESLETILPLLDDTPGRLAPPPPAPDTSSEALPPMPVPPPPLRPPVPVGAPRPPAPAPRAGRRRAPRRPGLAVAAGLAVAWTLSRAMPGDPAAPAFAALAAALVVLLLPRVGWLLATGIVAGVAAAAGRPGIALLGAIALLLPVFVPPGPRALRRAYLAAVAWVWVVLAGPLAGHDLLLTRPSGTPRPEAFVTSIAATAQHVLGPLGRSGAFSGAAVIAVAAVLAAWLFRLSEWPARLVLTAVWAASAVFTLGVVIDRSAAAGSAAQLRDPALIALVGTLCILVLSVRPPARVTPGRLDTRGGADQIS